MNRYQKRKARKEMIKKLNKQSKELGSAWESLLKECNGDIDIANQAISDLATRDIAYKEAFDKEINKLDKNDV